MKVITKPAYIALIVRTANELGCNSVSLSAESDSLVMLAASADRTVLLNASVPAEVEKPGGFAISSSKFTTLMSPSMSKATLTFNQYVFEMTWSRGSRRASEEARPFAGKRHPARHLPDTHDASAVVDVESLSDAIWESRDHETIQAKAAGGIITINDIKVGTAEGEAGGKYDWQSVACIINCWQHMESVTISLQNGGPMVLRFGPPVPAALCVKHA